MPWAIKYRPRIVDEIVGQEDAKEIIRGIMRRALKPDATAQSIIFQGSWGCGKCVTGDSWVKTSEGLRRIDDLVPKILGYTPVQNLSVRLAGRDHPVSHLYYGGEVDTIKLVIQDGIKLEGTVNHPVLVWEDFQPKWKTLNQIKKGDFVVGELNCEDWPLGEDPYFEYTEPIKGLVPLRLTTDIAYYIGLMVGDGYYTGKFSIGFCSSDDELKDFYEKMNLVMFKDSNTRLVDKRSKVGLETLRFSHIAVYRAWILSVFGNYACAATKKVPSVIRKAPFQHQFNFVQGIMDSDGSSSKDNRFEISLDAEDVIDFLATFFLSQGVDFDRTRRGSSHRLSLRRSPHLGEFFRLARKKKGTLNVCAWQSRRDRIPGSFQIVKFVMEDLKWTREERKKNSVVVRWKDLVTTPHLLRTSYEALREMLSLRQVSLPYVDPNWFFYEVLNVKGSRNEVFDLTVPGISSFNANGVIVHNTSCVRILAKALVCHNPTPRGEACLECSACQAIDQENSDNYTELDAASKSGVDAMRSLIQEVYLAPTGGARFRLIALDEAQALTTHAQQALLKTVEQSPEKTVIVFLTTHPEKLLPTIRSRCIPIFLEPINRKQMVEHLALICQCEDVPVEKSALELIALQERGHVRDAITKIEQIALAGPVTLERVRHVFHLDLEEKVITLLNYAGVDWERVTQEVEVLGQVYPIPKIWLSVLKLVVKAELFRVSPARVDANEFMKQLVDRYGGRLVVAAEWALAKGEELQLRSEYDLVVALSVLQEQLGKGQSTVQVQKKKMGPTKAQRLMLKQGPLHQESSKEEFINKLHLIPDNPTKLPN